MVYMKKPQVTEKTEDKCPHFARQVLQYEMVKYQEKQMTQLVKRLKVKEGGHSHWECWKEKLMRSWQMCPEFCWGILLESNTGVGNETWLNRATRVLQDSSPKCLPVLVNINHQLNIAQNHLSKESWATVFIRLICGPVYKWLSWLLNYVWESSPV